MAVIQQETENKENQPLSTSGSTGPITPVGSQAAAPQSGTQSAPQGSGRYTNLRKYIGAQNKPEATAGRLQSSAQKQTEGVQRDIDKTQNAFQASRDQVQQRLDQANQYKTQLEADPTQLTKNQADVQNFQRITSGDTSDIQNLPQYDQVSEAAAKAQQNLQGLTTESGRFNQLRNMFSQPGRQYTSGQGSLDNLLVQAAPGTLRNIEQSAQQFSKGIGQQLTAAQLQAEDQRKALLGAATTRQRELTGALTGQQTAFQKAQEEEAARLSQQRGDDIGIIQQAFTGAANLSPEQQARANELLNQAGLSLGMNTYNVDMGDLSKYYTTGQRNLTSADVVDANELARYQALAQLSGQAPTLTQAGNFGGGSAVQFTPGSDNAPSVLAQRIMEQGQAAQAALNQSGNFGENNLYSKLNQSVGGRFNLTNQDVQTLFDQNVNDQVKRDLINRYLGFSNYNKATGKDVDALRMASNIYGAATGKNLSSYFTTKDNYLPEIKNALTASMDRYKNQYGIGNQLGGAGITNSNTKGFTPTSGTPGKLK